MNLSSHLGADFLFSGNFLHNASFANVVSQRLFAVAVKPHLHSHHSRGGVSVVWRGNQNGVEVFDFFEHLAEVRELLRLRRELFASGI